MTMASATSRALELLELLESAGTRSVSELAERVHLDERSVRRHIERLREIGIPVEAVRGRGGGYRIAASYRLPPLMLSDDEAVAVLVGLTVARSTATQVSTSAALATAIAKIRRSLPRLLAERLAALLDVAVGATGAADEVDPSILLTVADAIRSRRPLAMSYQSGETTTQRSVQPHDLIAYEGRWYLVGLDSKTREIRTFRLDRVVRARALDGTFPAPPAHDAHGDLVRRFATAEYRHTVHVRVQALASDIEKRLPASVARVHRMPGSTDDEPWCRVTVRAQSLEWLPRTLLSLDCRVIVDEPEELRAELLEQAERLVRIATSRAER
jgi:predicted DNA-binding transcriptional regulator YafY